MRRATLALALVAGCGEGSIFLQTPALDSATQTVVLAVECDQELAVRVLDPTDLRSTAILLPGCNDSTITVLEVATPPEAQDLAFGPLEGVTDNPCANSALPAQTAHVARVRDGATPGFVSLEQGAPLPGLLSSFRYARPCPCRPFVRAGHLEVPLGERVFVLPKDARSLLVFDLIPAPRHEIHVFETDLESITPLHTATIAVTRTGDSNLDGPAHVTGGEDGLAYLAGDFGQIFEYRAQDGFRLLATVPGEPEVKRIAGGGAGDNLELYALTNDAQIWRYRSVEGWYRFPYAPELPQSASGNRDNVTWIGPGRAFVTPYHRNDVIYLDGDRASVRLWNGYGSIHAVGLIPDLGLIFGTRRNTFFKVDPDQPGTFEELLGPSGERMSPTEAWFTSIVPYHEGFVAGAEGPDTLVRFHPGWGYCPLNILDGEDVNLASFAWLGERILAGGTIKAGQATAGVLRLPLFRQQ